MQTASLIRDGLALQRAGALDEATQIYQQVLDREPEHFDALQLMATVCAQRNKLIEVVEWLKRALRVNNRLVSLHLSLGEVLLELKRFEEALACYQSVIEIDPADAESYFSAGVLAWKLGRLDEAIAFLRGAIGLRPEFASAHRYLGHILMALNRSEEALDSYTKALQIDPASADAHTNKGVALQERRQYEQALASFADAITIEPEHALAHWNRALLWLATGNYDEGWRAYEWRFKKEDLRDQYRPFPQASWRGDFDIRDKRLLITTEQGYGDFIQFLRYVFLAHERGALIILEVPRALLGLVSTISLPLTIVMKGEPLPDFDAHCPIMSLPLAFKTSVDTIPVYSAYIAAAKEKTDVWKTRLGKRTRPRVGIAWSGSTGHMNDAKRSIPLETLRPLFKEPVEWHSLQVAYSDKDQNLLENLPDIHQHQHALRDFADTAALIANLDLVISVDTAVAHLAGAMGRTVWILLPYFADFRWFIDREDSPWYPSARLFRQDETRQWFEPIEKLKKAIADPRFSCGLVFQEPWMRPEPFVSRTKSAKEEERQEEARQLSPHLYQAKVRDLSDLLQQGLVHHRANQLSEAYEIYKNILAQDSEHFDALQLAAALQHQLGNYQLALSLFDRALRIFKSEAHVFNNRGNTLKALGRFDETLKSYAEAIRIKPDFADAFNNQGIVLSELGRFDEAVNAYSQAIALNAANAAAFYNRAITLKILNRMEGALQDCDHAIFLKPDYAEAMCEKGNILVELRRLDEALASYRKASECKPMFAEAYNNLGSTLHRLRQYEEALENYEKAIQSNPQYAEAFNNRGNTLKELKRFDAALSSYAEAIKIKADFPEAFYNQAATQQQLRRFDEALASYSAALSLSSDYVDALYGRGATLQELRRYEEALVDYDRVLALDPSHALIRGARLHVKMHLCDWRDFHSELNALEALLAEGKVASTPFPLLSLFDQPSLHLEATRLYVEDKYPASDALGGYQTSQADGVIRIGYFSADFHNHATCYLMAELFECHDRSRFAWYGFSFGPQKQDEMRRRIEPYFDGFFDVSRKSDREVALMSRDLGIDIAVDLKGLTQDSRMGLFAEGCAPIQVSYLGYPGTLAATYIDYVVADNILIPKEDQHHYTEKIVYMPVSYQVNDSKRSISDKRFSRADLGLPEDGFVFCSFNSSHKILPTMFDSWMRILKAVDKSVLWLLEDKAAAITNLVNEAKIRGVDGARLIFAPRMKLDEHLARHQAAGLFLDTAPYNAHTTASDALWAGLPLLTLKGESFASRVATSLLSALDLPELITVSQAEYEEQAISLASEPGLLAELQGRLEHNRLTSALFNGQVFAKHIEAAYVEMQRRRVEETKTFDIDVATLIAAS